MAFPFAVAVGRFGACHFSINEPGVDFLPFCLSMLGQERCIFLTLYVSFALFASSFVLAIVAQERLVTKLVGTAAVSGFAFPQRQLLHRQHPALLPPVWHRRIHLGGRGTRLGGGKSRLGLRHDA